MKRVGFLGVGRIGLSRMAAMMESGAIAAAAFADPSDAMAAEAISLAPAAKRVDGMEGLLAEGLDGLVIATPSALHADQSIEALKAGVAVFCQKPLGRTAAEVRSVVDAARAANCLLGLDLSYRHVQGMDRIRDLIRAGDLGQIHAVDLVFHNAYGPDKDWFYDPALSGGGCVIDLGVHLVDLALWCLDFPSVADVYARLGAKGSPLQPGQVEDYAVATITAGEGVVITLACSWNLPAGRDAIIGASFYGKGQGAGLSNVDGSFLDFTTSRFRGTANETIATDSGDWSGRAAADWARRLAAGQGFDQGAERFSDVAEVLDRIYARGAKDAAPG